MVHLFLLIHGLLIWVISVHTVGMPTNLQNKMADEARTHILDAAKRIIDSTWRGREHSVEEIVDDIKNFLSDGLAIRKLSSSTYREHFTLSIEDKVLRAIVLGDNERNIESVLEADIEGPDCSCVYSYGFTNIFNNLNGLVTLYIAAGRHIWINKEAENYKADFLLGCVRD